MTQKKNQANWATPTLQEFEAAYDIKPFRINGVIIPKPDLVRLLNPTYLEGRLIPRVIAHIAEANRIRNLKNG